MDREEFDRKYTGRLNRQQSEAVHAVEGAVLLLAVPGSGKTTVLVTRLGYMLCCCGIPVNKILTMTYTKAATQEMKKRFARLFGGRVSADSGRGVFCSDNFFHINVLKKPPFQPTPTRLRGSAVVRSKPKCVQC